MSAPRLDLEQCLRRLASFRSSFGSIWVVLGLLFDLFWVLATLKSSVRPCLQKQKKGWATGNCTERKPFLRTSPLPTWPGAKPSLREPWLIDIDIHYILGGIWMHTELWMRTPNDSYTCGDKSSKRVKPNVVSEPARFEGGYVCQLCAWGARLPTNG